MACWALEGAGCTVTKCLHEIKIDQKEFEGLVSEKEWKLSSSLAKILGHKKLLRKPSAVDADYIISFRLIPAGIHREKAPLSEAKALLPVESCRTYSASLNVLLDMIAENDEQAGHVVPLEPPCLVLELCKSFLENSTGSHHVAMQATMLDPSVNSNVARKLLAIERLLRVINGALKECSCSVHNLPLSLFSVFSFCALGMTSPPSSEMLEEIITVESFPHLYKCFVGRRLVFFQTRKF